MSDHETDDQLAYRLGVTLGLDYGLPVQPPIVARHVPATLPSFLDIHVETDPELPPDTIVFRTTPPRPHSWVRDRFIEKGHTMNDQHIPDWQPNALGRADNETRARLAAGEPAARRGDPSTSHAAAASVKGAGTIRAHVYQILRSNPDGLTHEQIIAAYQHAVDELGWRPAADQSIRSRVKELEREGVVKRNGTATDRTKAKRRTHRWFAVTDPAEQQRRRAAQEYAVASAANQRRVEGVLTESLATTLASPAGDLARLDPKLQESLATRVPEAVEILALANDLTEDIQASRRAGAFTSREMARFLVDKGWRRSTP